MSAEEQEYSLKLEKIKKINLLKIQRDSDSSYKRTTHNNVDLFVDNNSDILNVASSPRNFICYFKIIV